MHVSEFLKIIKNIGILIICLFSLSSFACNENLIVIINPIISTITNNAALGDIIYKREGTLASLTGKNVQFICDTTLDQKKIITIGRMHGFSVGKNIYSTNLNGIGIRLTAAVHQQSGLKWKNFPFTSNQMANADLNANDVLLRIELVKTANHPDIGLLNFSENNALVFKGINEHSFSTVDIHISSKISNGSCNILTDSIHINMSPVEIGDLINNPNGRVNSQDFSIPIHCENTHGVFMTIQAKPFNNLLGVLSTTDASGVENKIGILLRYMNSPVILNRPFNISNLFHQSKENKILISASYFFIGKRISPGFIYGTATVKIDYI